MELGGGVLIGKEGLWMGGGIGIAAARLEVALRHEGIELRLDLFRDCELLHLIEHVVAPARLRHRRSLASHLSL